MEIKNLEAKLRDETGKNNCNRLRAAGFIPGVVYSHGKSEALKISKKAFYTLFKGHISESIIIDLNVKDKETYQVFIKDFQRDPITDEIQHIDFFKVTTGEKIKTTIALNFTGQAFGVKEGGVFEVIDRVLEVEILPKDLTEKIEIDISNLAIGDAIHIKDIKAPESMIFTSEDEHVVAHVCVAKVIEEEETEEEETADEISEETTEEEKKEEKSAE